MSDIGRRKREIDQREREERMALLSDHQKKFSAEYAKLKEDCAKEGHALGRIWDNGIGWEWKICGRCGASFDHHCYSGMATNE